MPILIVPTPIGNMEDFTLRALRSLRESDIIACEDTRRTLKLLSKYGIKKHLLATHRHNERGRAGEIADRAEAGETVALVSDAGTPCISDPGSEVLAEAIRRGIDVDVLPGPSAVLPALLLSGLPAQPFTFFGFAGETASARKKLFGEAAMLTHTVVFYSAPHDVIRDLRESLDIFGDRKAAVARELTKVHQEVIRGTISDIIRRFETIPPRGEMVLVIAGRAPDVQEADWRSEARAMRDDGMSDRDISEAISDRLGVPKNQIKKFLLCMEEDI